MWYDSQYPQYILFYSHVFLFLNEQKKDMVIIPLFIIFIALFFDFFWYYLRRNNFSFFLDISVQGSDFSFQFFCNFLRLLQFHDSGNIIWASEKLKIDT